MINNRHQGEPIYIIGGGSSLKDFDFNRLAGKVTIACNKALLYIEPTYLVYMDDQFYDWYEDEVRAFGGMKFTHSWNKKREGVTFAKNLGSLGLSDDFKTGLFHGGNAAYLALNLACVMGGETIYLLGVDMCYGNGATHFHGGYPNKDVIGENRFKHMIKAFNYGSVILKERGAQIYNCSSISKLECFDMYDINQIKGGQQMTFAELLKQKREATTIQRKAEPADMAVLLGITTKMYNMLESGKRKQPEYKDLQNISKGESFGDWYCCQGCLNEHIDEKHGSAVESTGVSHEEGNCKLT